MEIKVFSDVIDVLGKVAKAVRSLTGFAQHERERQIAAVTETFTLLDTALNLVINRLGDLSLMEDDLEFERQIRTLSDAKEWTAVERDVRLCRNLRAAGQELKSLYWRIRNGLGSREVDALKTLVDRVLEQEYELGEFIGSSLSQLAGLAGRPEARKTLETIRCSLRMERHVLIALELKFWEAITPVKRKRRVPNKALKRDAAKSRRAP